jgi:hypothetical protein
VPVPPPRYGLASSRSYWTVVVVDAISAVLIGLGYLGARAEHSLAHQVPWVELALVGIICTLAVHCLWLVGASRRLSLRRHQALSLVAARRGTERQHQVPSASDETLVAVDRSRLGHRPTCLAVRGKATYPAPATHDPCPLCQH